ncbi:MAG: hypothetical protein KF841_02185 [Phycisphaerae bacterium]|nr:hypothetical protein [Phycisphaerae bacterium]
MTNPQFLEFATELTPSEIQLRLQTVERLQAGLVGNLKARQSSTTPPPKIENDDLQLVSDVFRAAARNLDQWEPEKHVGAALLEFAAGTLGARVPFNAAGNTYPVAEPNSWMLFLFAELGIAAQRLDAQFWNPPLLLDLVKMQRYYIYRFRHHGPLTTFTNPIYPLDKQVRGRIDSKFAIHTPGTVDLNSLILENIQIAGRPRSTAKT